MYDCGNHARRRRNRQAHKILLSGTTRVGRLRIGSDVEARQPASTRHEKSKTEDRAQLDDLRAHHGINRRRQQFEAPHPGKQRRGHTKCNHVSQRVEFLSDRKSTRLNSSHSQISYAVFCLKKKKKKSTFIFSIKKNTLNSNTSK